MTIFTPEMFDRIDIVRAAASTAVKESTLPDELQIDMRQSLNQAIDGTVAAFLKANAQPAPNAFVAPSNVQF